jgi:plasmid stability protein
MDERDLTIDMSDEAFAVLQKQAKETGRTPEDEARAILIAAFEPEPAPPS